MTIDCRLERMIFRQTSAPPFARGRARSLGRGLMTSTINYHRDCTIRATRATRKRVTQLTNFYRYQLAIERYQYSFRSPDVIANTLGHDISRSVLFIKEKPARLNERTMRISAFLSFWKVKRFVQLVAMKVPWEINRAIESCLLLCKSSYRLNVNNRAGICEGHLLFS
jgi:hypothetical protein